MKSVLILFSLSLIFITSCNNHTNEQTESKDNLVSEPIVYTGSFCTGPDEYSPITFTREYQKSGDNFITLYKISSTENGYYLNITATHLKSLKKITVGIDDITVNTNGHISSQEFKYDEPSTEAFGYRGYFQEQFDAQQKLPFDLALKFTSREFQYVKIASVVRDNQMGSTKWYLLDNKNLDKL